MDRNFRFYQILNVNVSQPIQNHARWPNEVYQNIIRSNQISNIRSHRTKKFNLTESLIRENFHPNKISLANVRHKFIRTMFYIFGSKAIFSLNMLEK